MMDYETKLQITFVTSFVGVIVAGLFIVRILIEIEVNKALFYSSAAADDKQLELTEDDGEGNPPRMEVEKTGDGISKNKEQEPAQPRRRRVRLSFKAMQIVSVACLILLTYLLLVVSTAPVWASTLGSLIVLSVFLRYQIGEEVRRQRLDRLFMIVTLFLLIASLLSMATYCKKNFGQGEIYEGPARIVGYNYSSYSNTQSDPITRTNLMVEFGKEWACPLSNGKLCQTQVQGALCQADQDGNRKRELKRKLEGNSNTTTNTTAENQNLEQENKDLEQENEALEQELDGKYLLVFLAGHSQLEHIFFTVSHFSIGIRIFRNGKRGARGRRRGRRGN
jgi:hypothetical protein